MRSTDRIRVVIADDSAFMRKLIRSFLEHGGDIEVVGEASDGAEAVAAAERLRPDAMTMDFRMPVMTGAEAIRRIMRMSGRLPGIVMLSAYTKEEAEETLASIRAGAVDCVAKPSGEVSTDLVDIRDELLAKVRAAAHARVTPAGERGRRRIAATATPRTGVPDAVILIGGSTGAPPVIERVVAGLQVSSRVAVIVVQHMPAYFTDAFARRLSTMTGYEVGEAVSGPVRAGRVTVIPGGAETAIRRVGARVASFAVRRDPNEHRAPDINSLFTDAAATFGSRCVAVVLSGMGSDGADGSLEVRRAGGRVLVQEPDACVISSMPERTLAAGATRERLPVDDIIAVLNGVISAYA